MAHTQTFAEHFASVLDIAGAAAALVVARRSTVNKLWRTRVDADAAPRTSHLDADAAPRTSHLDADAAPRTSPKRGHGRPPLEASSCHAKKILTSNPPRRRGRPSKSSATEYPAESSVFEIARDFRLCMGQEMRDTFVQQGLSEAAVWEALRPSLRKFASSVEVFSISGAAVYFSKKKPTNPQPGN